MVLGDLPVWTAALAAAGIEVAEAGPCDLAVCRRADLADAVAERPRAIIVVTRAPGRRLRQVGYTTCLVAVRPGRAGPRLVIACDARATRAALCYGAAPPTLGRRLVARLGATLTARGIGPRSWYSLLAVRDAAIEPFAAAALGGAGRAWYLGLGDGDDMQRVVLHALDGPTPDTVAKVSRIAGDDDSLAREWRAHRLLSASAPAAAANVPELGRPRLIEGHWVARQARARGAPLGSLLDSDVPRARKLALIGEVCDWIDRLGAESALAPSRMGPELARLERLGREHGLSGGALTGIGGCLQHGDLGSWNVHAEADGGIAVLDWESARSPGLPLWDLLYFLFDALPRLDGRPGVDGALALARGDSSLTGFLSARVDVAAGRQGVPPGTLGTIAALCWLHHARSPGVRAGRLGRASGSAPTLARLAEAWLADPVVRARWPTDAPDP